MLLVKHPAAGFLQHFVGRHASQVADQLAGLFETGQLFPFREEGSPNHLDEVNGIELGLHLLSQVMLPKLAADNPLYMRAVLRDEVPSGLFGPLADLFDRVTKG
jgi:hypothetical protein